MDTDEIKVEWADEEVSGQSGMFRKRGGTFDMRGESGRQYETVRENGRTYLVRMCAAGWEDEERMLAEGKADGLLNAAIRSRNGEECCFYDITGKQSLLSECEKAEIDFHKLRAILIDAGGCLEKTTEYLLREDGIVLDPAYIYAGIDGGERLFLYDSSQEGTFALHIRAFAAFLAQKLDYRDEKAVELAGRFCRYTDGENFSMEIFLEENRQYFEEQEDERAFHEDEEMEEEGGMAEPAAEKADEGTCGGCDPVKREPENRTWISLLPGAVIAVLVLCAVWRLSAGDAAVVMAAGACAGIVAAALYAYVGYTKKMLLKKETEVYRLTPESKPVDTH